ncbi:S-locus-specific glycoprotein BS29-2-like [Populus alba]|uniref:S-locus-specific glycoprotein BS29-2-like n=1 Tax=Populus alba TaxID=43335 RepID=UPI00158BDC8E|nr:receptor-like serine/threonine-protein kinase SD1-8 [Populus alba]
MKLGCENLKTRGGLDRFLTSWRSADDPGIGRPTLRLGSTLVVPHTIIFLYPKAKTCNDKPAIPADQDSAMERLLVDHSGFVKAVKWHESDGQWKENWRAPRSKCDSYGWNPSDWLLRNGSGGSVRKRLESSSAVWVDMDMSHADCERECKRKCSCSAYASVDIPDKGTGCLTWYGELVDAVSI